MWAIFSRFRGFFWGFWVCYGAGAFDTGAFRRAVLFGRQGYFVFYPVLWLFCLCVCVCVCVWGGGGGGGDWVLGLRSIL